ncbi:RNase adapter RapZ [Moraxella sp. Tifton1]|uniref:RNase adapter RapZ n=1 Tax=Moraxella oculi TaxID=2940516 RepID=UPI002010EB56|nr:RNase adapter RapZ [Moraxella sp. Tifton1]MCL1623861.1 RNase adapter RapZ [Moraxella sp. Tifton1]
MDKQPSIIIVSGRSGSGKTSILNVLEDFGFYVIDNLPLSLAFDAVRRLAMDDRIHKIALGIDSRLPQADLKNFPVLHQSLKDGYGEQAVTVLYAIAEERVLVARFGSTRRVHPLMATNNNLPDAIHSEIALLEPVANLADIEIDTSLLNVHELKVKVRDCLGLENKIVINVLSFGFKYGVPLDSDLVFDMRILPNPHWHEHLQSSTGEDEIVKSFFAEFDEVAEMTDDLIAYLLKWLPHFSHNNRHSITVAIGCTGGKHRSVYVASMVAKALLAGLPSQFKVRIKHREKRHW